MEPVSIILTTLAAQCTISKITEILFGNVVEKATFETLPAYAKRMLPLTMSKPPVNHNLQKAILSAHWMATWVITNKLQKEAEEQRKNEAAHKVVIETAKDQLRKLKDKNYLPLSSPDAYEAAELILKDPRVKPVTDLKASVIEFHLAELRIYSGRAHQLLAYEEIEKAIRNGQPDWFELVCAFLNELLKGDKNEAKDAFQNQELAKIGIQISQIFQKFEQYSNRCIDQIGEGKFASYMKLVGNEFKEIKDSLSVLHIKVDGLHGKVDNLIAYREKDRKTFEDLISTLQKQKIKKNSISQAEKAIDYLFEIISLEEKINFIENKIPNKASNAYAEFNQELSSRKNKRNKCINQLYELLSAHKEAVTGNFVEILTQHYVYDWDDEKSLKKVKSLTKITNLILQILAEIDTDDLLKLRVGALKMNWAMGDVSNASDIFSKTYRQAKASYNSETDEIFTYQELFKNVLDYGCGFNLELIHEYREIAENWVGSNQARESLIVTTLQCGACRYLKENNFEAVNSWIEHTEEGLNKLINDYKISVESQNYKWSQLFLIKGTYYFKQKQFDEAKIVLEKALDYFNISKLSSHEMERIFIRYMLYKINKNEGNKKDMITNKFIAMSIMERSIRKNYCLYDFKEVYDEMESDIDIF